jgi:hypothetical protein
VRLSEGALAWVYSFASMEAGASVHKGGFLIWSICRATHSIQSTLHPAGLATNTPYYFPSVKSFALWPQVHLSIHTYSINIQQSTDAGWVFGLRALYTCIDPTHKCEASLNTGPCKHGAPLPAQFRLPRRSNCHFHTQKRPRQTCPSSSSLGFFSRGGTMKTNTLLSLSTQSYLCHLLLVPGVFFLLPFLAGRLACRQLLRLPYPAVSHASVFHPTATHPSVYRSSRLWSPSLCLCA